MSQIPVLLKGMEKVEFFEVSATAPFWTKIANSDVEASASTTITDYKAKVAQLSIENYDALLPEVLDDYFVDTNTDTTTFTTEQGAQVRVNSGASKAVSDGKKILFIAYSRPLDGSDQRYLIYGMSYHGGENVLATGTDQSTMPLNFYPIQNGTGSAISLDASLFDATLINTAALTASIADRTSSNFEIVALPSS